MSDKLNEIFEEESIELGLPPEKIEELANKGCQMAFNDNLRERIKLLGGLENLDKEFVRKLVLEFVTGGTILELSGLNKSSS